MADAHSVTFAQRPDTAAGRKPPVVIAEIGANHCGSMALAEKMVAIAAQFCEVDAVKFQKRDPRALLSDEQYNAPHPNPMHSYGETYGAHREYLELSIAQHRDLMAHAERAGVTYATSVWDLPSARAVIDMEPEFIKVPSATNLHFDLLRLLCDTFEGQIHVSLGMTTREEEDAIVALIDGRGRLSSAVLYACTSGYPVAFDELCLEEVARLKEAYGAQLAGVGFSGHHLGIAADIAAQTLGATHIERHFTLDRTLKGTDHAASLEPDGMRRLVRDTRAVAAALSTKSDGILPVEKPQRDKLKWHA